MSTDYIGTADTRIWLRCKGYASKGGRKIRPQPESGKKTIVGRPSVGSHSYEVADERFETLVRSFTLMDAVLAHSSCESVRLAYFEGVGQPQRASMQVG